MTIAENVQMVRDQIAAACAKAKRDPASVTLVAVSKTHPASVVLEAAACGLQHFGENRVEESTTKIPAVMAQTDLPLIWHMIGHIQSRKAKEIPPLYQVVHSVDTLKLAERLSREVVERGGSLDVLLEVNISGEASKAGFAAYGWVQNAETRATLEQEADAFDAAMIPSPDYIRWSEGAVKASLRQLFDKLGVRTRSQLVKVALEEYRDQI